ncbi:MAG: DUF3991 and toprim domain-containing protein [Gammaproteobacteria bacterium]|nr:DUF3991 and toprim domain-containing protein [Gammaproteobacteria bacterium]
MSVQSSIGFSMDDELNTFKQTIDLREYAVSVGYEIDKRKSSQTTFSMKNGAGERIVTTVKNGIWVYFDPNAGVDGKRSGTIIDFVQQTRSANLGQVRQILRDYLNSPSPLFTNLFVQNQVKERVVDHEAVKKFLKRFKPASQVEFLKDKGIHKGIQGHPIFKNRALKGFDNAVIFPHWDEQGVCGYEIVKEGFKSFSKNGSKTLWRSNVPEVLETIVFTESAIKAMCYHRLFNKPEYTMYVATSGNWSPDVDELIVRIIEKHKPKTVIGAFDNDKGGWLHVEHLENTVSRCPDVQFSAILPVDIGDDWEDVLKQEIELENNECVKTND